MYMQNHAMPWKLNGPIHKLYVNCNVYTQYYIWYTRSPCPELPSPLALVNANDKAIILYTYIHACTGKIYGALVQFGSINIHMNERVCGALVQLGCYQHKHK